METNSAEGKLEGWTKEQKFELLEALKEVGSQNVEQIHEYLSYKTQDEIKTALEYYKKKASACPTPAQKRERKINVPTRPIIKWAKFIADSHEFEDLQTETATALRLIANFEDKPPATCTERIDFKKVYHVMADALEGKPLSEEPYVMALLDKCVIETALTSKTLCRGSTSIKNILQRSCNPDEADVKPFTAPTTDLELLTLRHFISKKNYNPLNIPETGLKLSLQG